MLGDNFFSLESGESSIDGVRTGWITVKSPSLKSRADISAIIPEKAEDLGPLPVYIFLHGIYGSHWAWIIKGNLHKTSSAMIEDGLIKPAIILMPSDGLWGDGSGYVDHGYQDFESWIVKDITSAFQQAWPSIDISGPRFIAGLSMGGFGALYLGSKYHDNFRGISAHSSVTHLEQLESRIERPFPESMDLHSPNYSAIHWIEAHKKTLPNLRFDCGIEDELLMHNRELHDKLISLGISHSFQEFPGDHSWPYWEIHARESLSFFSNCN